MNLTNATKLLEDLSLHHEEQEDGGGGGLPDKVGVVPRHAYLGIIYFIVILGTIGNACIMALMSSRDFRGMSYSVYLRVLAVSDTLLLVTVATEDILDHQFQSLDDYVTSSTGLCKFWRYISSVVRVTSPWLVVCLTADRFVAVVVPQKRSLFCTMRTAVIASSVLVVTTLIEALFFIILAKTDHEEQDCVLEDWEALGNYMIFRTLVTETTLACLFVFCLNLYIVIVIHRSRRSSAKAAAPGQKKKPSIVDKTTISLMAVSIMMFVALVPISCIQVVEWEMENEISRRESNLNPNDTEAVQSLDRLIEERHDLGDIWPAFNLIFLFNFGHNFYVMMLTGPKFRQKFLSWFRCFDRVRKSKDPSSLTSFNNIDTQVSTAAEDRI